MNWRVRVSAKAQIDLARILTYTSDTFGPRYVATYAATLTEALTSIGHDPVLPGSSARDDLLPSLRSLHVARHGRKGRHVVMYRVTSDRTVEVVRILHDAMDFSRHL